MVEPSQSVLELINMFRKMYNTDLLSKCKNLEGKATELGKHIETINSFQIDTDQLSEKIGCAIIKIHDKSFTLEWYIHQLYLKSKDTNWFGEEFSITEINFLKIIWAMSKKCGIYVSKDVISLDFIIIMVDNFDFNQYTLKFVYKPSTLESKISVGYLDHETIQPLFIGIHNKIRLAHNANPLVWSEELVLIAKNITEQKAKGEYNPPAHRTHGMLSWCGENIPNAVNIIGDWYETYKYHKYKYKNGVAGSAPFTQMVWKSTKAIGVYMDKTKETYILTAVYIPTGNEPRTYIQNVQKPIKKYLNRSSFLWT